MRVLSFIPALLLAATSFVAAAPAGVPAGTPAAPSCVPPAGNDAPIANVIVAIQKASTDIEPLSAQLVALKGSATPDAAVVADIVVKIDAAVKAVVAEVQAEAKVDISGLDLSRIGAAIYVCIGLVATVIDCLISIVIVLRANISATLKADITVLLRDVLALCVGLKVYAAGSLVVVLGPLLVAVTSIANLCIDIVAGLNVLAVVA